MSLRLGLVLVVGLLIQGGATCADCPDPSRPWMRGNVEKYCGQTPAQIDAMRRDQPEKADRILLCACQHMCDPTADRADETGGLAWDAACETRCNPSNCACDHSCGS